MNDFIDKKKLSEQDISTKFIVPSIQRAGWDLMLQVSEQKLPITEGRIILSGKSIKRGEKKKPDFVLSYHKNFPLAVIEIKNNNFSIATGIQQAMSYAEILDAPFAYSTNGDGFLEHDFLTGKQRDLLIDQLPSPTELYNRYKQHKNIGDEVEKIIQTPYYQGNSKKTPRYYQQVAINRTVKAVADEQKRILLVMATGTGKTFTAGQIIWRLWKSGAKKRILFLADRNILVDQTMTNDFKHFGGAMCKLSTKYGAIEYKDNINLGINSKTKQVDKAYEIYLGLYQALTGNVEERDIYKQFSSNFFDLIIIDECHRGSAKEDSNWREILEYFSSATQIGLTATPKETKDVSNIEYFGEPIYTYSLKQGIDDGFLAPYKVIRVMLDKDIGGYRPAIQDRDREGNQIVDKTYESKDFDRKIVLTKRTEIVAKEITRFLKKTNRFNKTIVFCVDIEHAERMTKALIDENSDLVKQNRKYIMQITGDNIEGKMELDNFTDVEKTYPTIVTTSKLLTTGVDAQTCKLIVLDANINSSTEFKQIIGRGTRIREDMGKTHFTILDFRKATDLFSDPNFDGDPIQIKEIKQGEEISDGDNFDEDELTKKSEDQNIESDPAKDSDFIVNQLNSEPFKEKTKTEKIYVDNVEVNIVYKQKQFLDENGKLITSSFKDFSKKQILKKFSSLDDFINKWSKQEQKILIIQELENQGIDFFELQNEIGDIGKNIDPFDLILHIAFGKNKLITRQERVNNIRKKNYLAKYNGIAKNVLENLLEKYSNQGLSHIEDINILTINPFNSIGSPIEIIQEFGGRDAYFLALRDLEREIYSQINY
jgi:type I restriction enzyme R subunit